MVSASQHESIATAQPELMDLGGKIRQGEELDVAAVHGWLLAQGLPLQGMPEVTSTVAVPLTGPIG